MQPTQVNKITSSCEICSGPMTLGTAWKILNKPLLNMHPRVPIKQKLSDPKCSSYPSTSINDVKTCYKEEIHSQASQPQAGMRIGTQQAKEPEPNLEHEFQGLHLNLLVLKVLAHAPIYNAMLEKYVESLELGKNGSTFVQGEVPAKMEDPGLFTLPYRLGNSKTFDNLADLGSCVNIIPLYLFKKLNI
nr:hypothetical protein [Tanacetum cinerariifolium]